MTEKVGTRCNGFELKEGRFRLDIWKKNLHHESGKALEHAAQRNSGYPWKCLRLDWLGFEQPALAV